MKVNGFFSDLTALKNIVVKRKERIMGASPKPVRHDPIKALARVLHPKTNLLVIENISDIDDDTKLIRLTQGPLNTGRLPVFQAGQYASITFDFGEYSVNRPFFLASPSSKALPPENLEDKAYIEIVVDKKSNSKVSEYIWSNWKVGMEIDAAFPHGKFFYEPLRDASNLIACAEDIGIIPFYSMLCDIVEKDLPLKLKIFYKKSASKKFLFLEEMNEIINTSPNKFSLCLINDENTIINDIQDKVEEAYLKEATFFICGSQNFVEQIKVELPKMKIENRNVRKQIVGAKENIYDDVHYPSKAVGKTFQLKIIYGVEEKIIEAKSDETVLISLERAKISKSTHCRTGECGYCRSKILAGEVFVNSTQDYRRIADKNHGYFHPCCSYPVSDLTIDLLK